MHDRKTLLALLRRAHDLLPMGTWEVDRTEEDDLVVEINQVLQEEKESNLISEAFLRFVEENFKTHKMKKDQENEVHGQHESK